MECIGNPAFSISLVAKLVVSLIAIEASGKVNESKSSILFSNVIVEVREDVSSILNFKEKHLLVKYLGLPLFSSRLKLSECLPLIEKIRKRSAGWKTALLSYAGRAELINSTLSSLNIFWAETFVLPKSSYIGMLSTSIIVFDSFLYVLGCLLEIRVWSLRTSFD
ncbi:hypothetical protein AAC387_Pa01g2034 [Persea americana]